MSTARARPSYTHRSIRVVDVVVVAGGFLIGGPSGLLIALAGQIAVRRVGPRLPAFVSFVLLVFSGAITAAQPWSESQILFNFAKDHELAAAAAQGAGVLLFVALVEYIRDERAPRKHPSAER